MEKYVIAVSKTNNGVIDKYKIITSLKIKILEPTEEILTKEKLIEEFDKYEYYTALKKVNDYVRKAEIYKVEIDDNFYFKTVKNDKKEDNLGKLPIF